MAEIRGWSQCRHALAGGELASDPHLAGLEPSQPNNLLFMDGEPHRRLRGLVMPYFTSHRLEGLGEQVETTCREALGEALSGARTDLVADVVEPLVLDAIFSAMAVPPGNRARLGALSREMLGLLEPDLPPAARRRTANAAMRATMLFERDRLRGEASGLHSSLEAAAEAGAIPSKLARSTPVVVLHGGYENPLNQLGCLTAWAVANPERFKEASASAPALLFEEVLRVFSPVRVVARWTATNDDRKKPHRKGGDLVWVSLESANRDSHRFTDPDEIELSKRQQHIGFGHGAHACLGTALARLEGQALIGALSAVPDAVMREFSTEWRDGVVARGPAKIVRR